MGSQSKKSTQGHKKMMQYITDLIRNKSFQRDIKRLRNLSKKYNTPEGNYDTWTKSEQEKHDFFNKELKDIIKDYKNLNRRAKKLFGKDAKLKKKIAELYALDGGLINYAHALSSGDKEAIEIASAIYDVDICQILDIHDEFIEPFNEGDDFFSLRLDKQLLFTAFPVVIAVNKKATKRDVIDFIEKKWHLIDNRLRWIEGMEPLRVRPRKYPQKLIDYIWEHQSLPAKQIKSKLDKEFPGNGIVYYEISIIIKDEKKRRARDLT